MKFEEIYKLTFQYVYRFFYYKSVNPAEIEDLSHDVYMRFYTKYSQQLPEEEETKKLLFGFCRNVYREWVRQKVKERRADFDDNLEYEDSYDDFSDEAFEQKIAQQKEVVKEAIKKLNPKIQYVLEARFIHNKSRKEIAEHLEIKEKDVHTYQKRGIKYLKNLINQTD